MKWGDFVAGGLCIIIAALLWTVPALNSEHSGVFFEVVAENEVLMAYDLIDNDSMYISESIGYILESFSKEKGPGETIISMSRNKIDFYLIIKDGKVGFTESNCPQKVCINTGFIGKPGEFAVCLPAGVFVRIKGRSEKDDPDFVLG